MMINGCFSVSGSFPTPLPPVISTINDANKAGDVVHRRSMVSTVQIEETSSYSSLSPIYQAGEKNSYSSLRLVRQAGETSSYSSQKSVHQSEEKNSYSSLSPIYQAGGIRSGSSQKSVRQAGETSSYSSLSPIYQAGGIRSGSSCKSLFNPKTGRKHHLPPSKPNSSITNRTSEIQTYTEAEKEQEEIIYDGDCEGGSVVLSFCSGCSCSEVSSTFSQDTKVFPTFFQNSECAAPANILVDEVYAYSTYCKVEEMAKKVAEEKHQVKETKKEFLVPDEEPDELREWDRFYEDIPVSDLWTGMKGREVCDNFALNESVSTNKYAISCMVGAPIKFLSKHFIFPNDINLCDVRCIRGLLYKCLLDYNSGPNPKPAPKPEFTSGLVPNPGSTSASGSEHTAEQSSLFALIYKCLLNYNSDPNPKLAPKPGLISGLAPKPGSASGPEPEPEHTAEQSGLLALMREVLDLPLGSDRLILQEKDDEICAIIAKMLGVKIMGNGSYDHEEFIHAIKRYIFEMIAACGQFVPRRTNALYKGTTISGSLNFFNENKGPLPTLVYRLPWHRLWMFPSS
ncbi:MAG: hypothetical protein LBG13_03120 [Holosporales bacterium]|jgi:hypothetical protein|nr:hypothetical protein [Holosporales bacterium]